MKVKNYEDFLHVQDAIYDKQQLQNCWDTATRLAQPTNQVEQLVMCDLITHIYNCGYMAGHNDTVESQFTDIHSQDMGTYQKDVVEELFDELQTNK